MPRPPRHPADQQLSLFDAWPLTQGPDPAPAPARAAAPAATPLPAPSLRVFRHPNAQRELRLGEHVVGYALRRGRRRSIGFVVGVEGLSVAAPRWVGQGDIDAALREKADWILRKLAEQHERGERLQAARVDWRDGASIPFLGEPVVIVLDPRSGGMCAGASLETLLDGPNPRLTLNVALPVHAAPGQIRRLSLSSAQTRWGSASADGSVRLNWRLVHFGMATIDYVVAHELAHLRHMDHGPAFWDVVRSVVPDVDRARSTLKAELVPVFD